MHSPSMDVDYSAAMEDGIGGAGVPYDPPSSAWSSVAAPADEDAGFEVELSVPADDGWPLEWGAARLGIP